MRSYIFTLLICILSFLSFGQKTKEICGDTSLLNKYFNEDDKEMQLSYLIQSSDSIHYRFRIYGLIVDVWSKDGKVFNGLVTSNICQIFYDKKNSSTKSSKIIFNKYLLTATESKHVYDLSKMVDTLPDEKSIKAWRRFICGAGCSFEFSTPNEYCFKTYGNPESQDSSILEAKLIKRFIDSINNYLGLEAKYNILLYSLKSGSYQLSGPLILSVYKDGEKFSNENKPYYDYLKSMCDSLNNCYRDTLDKIFKSHKKLNCHFYYYLKFSRNNKLLKISVSFRFSKIGHRMGYIACKRKIKKTFRKINMDLIKVPGSYWIGMDYSEGQVNLIL